MESFPLCLTAWDEFLLATGNHAAIILVTEIYMVFWETPTYIFCGVELVEGLQDFLLHTQVCTLCTKPKEQILFITGSVIQTANGNCLL